MQEKFSTSKSLTKQEKNEMIKAEIEVYRERLEVMKEKLPHALEQMIKNFEHSIDNARELQKVMKENDVEELSNEKIGINDLDTYAGYILRDNFHEWNTHVSWTYKELKEFEHMMELVQEKIEEINKIEL